MRDDSIAPVHLRLGKLFTPIENWRRVQQRIPTRADAIKALVKIGLEAERQRLEQPAPPDDRVIARVGHVDPSDSQSPYRP